MQRYAPASRDEAFAQAREYFAETEDWLVSGDASVMQHGDLEEQMEKRGREITRRMLQGHLDVLAAREERRHDVTGDDTVVRLRAERGRVRPRMTKFGQVSVSRIAYRSLGRSNVHPLDAALNLPGEKHSHELRKLAAAEAARGSHEAAAAAITRAAGVQIGKRQVEELARRAAAHARRDHQHARAEAAEEESAGSEAEEQGEAAGAAGATAARTRLRMVTAAPARAARADRARERRRCRCPC
jgi:hypothetical protein